MKKLVVTLMLFVASMTVQAGNILDNAIFGVSVLSQDTNLVVKLPTSTVNVEESGTGISVYFDSFYRSKYRFNTALSFVSYEVFDFASLTVAADYLFPYNQQISFFAGGSAGGGMQQYTDTSISDSSFGLLYGVQFGGIAYLNKQIMMELGYRHRIADIETEIDSIAGTTLIDEQSDLYLSFLLMF